MIVKIIVEKVSDAKAEDGTSFMQTTVAFKGWTTKAEETFSRYSNEIRNRAQALVAIASELEALNG